MTSMQKLVAEQEPRRHKPIHSTSFFRLDHSGGKFIFSLAVGVVIYLQKPQSQQPEQILSSPNKHY